MRVYNITNSNGNKVANQFIIDDKNKESLTLKLVQKNICLHKMDFNLVMSFYMMY